MDDAGGLDEVAIERLSPLQRRQMAEAVERALVVRAEVERVSTALRRRLKLLVGKPGLDGHSNGAEQIAVAARDAPGDDLYRQPAAVMVVLVNPS